MDGKKLSRRTVLTLGGALVAGGMLGVGGWEGWHCLAGNADPPAKPGGDPPEKPWGVKGAIDAHVHLVNPNLPGVPLASAPDGTPLDGAAKAMAKAIQDEMKQAGVEHALCMPRREATTEDPLGIKGTQAIAALVPGLHPIGLADPERFDDEHLARVEAALAKKPAEVVALKAYLGYLHHFPYDPGYRPYYTLAGKYGVPVIFHTGDTWSQLAKVKYAHPLYIDEVAVDFPDTKFVIAHLGNPWLMDAAEVVYKNNKDKGRENVWADLSALVVGKAEDFENYRKQGVLKGVIEDVRKALEFAERPDRFLFGSDWPLAPLTVYRDFIRELVPEQYHQMVFHDNAKDLFKLG